MSRASEHTTLLPLSGLLLALLMIASLLGLQGAIDRALTVSSPRRLIAPTNHTLAAPALIARQPVERAAEAAASAEEASPAGPARRSIAPVANTTEPGISPVPLVPPTMTKLDTKTPEEILTTNIFKPGKVHSGKRLITKSAWAGKPGGAQLFQSSSEEALAHGKTVQPAKINGRSRNSGR